MSVFIWRCVTRWECYKDSQSVSKECKIRRQRSIHRCLTAAMKMKYLHVCEPPTTVASEQLFSSAGQIYPDRRNSFLGENAEQVA